ncbi:tRNA (adenosine(37)-N6)-threonylcarbamoyltransferase complex dimerization subunit type 1 TsaB [Legionella septentrionalis]|uniref:tRNA (adenosine(37)-N6)-threonylcarbamoyltransferase complex dimerization subunit type 1 TsaB n=1 Tax=Legionella septentrionalis TaxID=2498109 RepID=UPI000F8F22B0|nr:tRNA (adenosine(37)-N6)-threonylcarbamoyltransferase complex dimerization subunit type 1 TsaB [Legionella septentrionalis]RUQ94336.1 tRNA (adenosine(37)-N6)-threonylcarbamoyltransferase complex dimerization subunit type 1 TsaB [Legionella septentrionalis]
MNLLALDTSTETATVAVALGEQVFGKEQKALSQHAQLLLPMISTLLAEANLSFKQLDGIVFGRGPGSFTGLRIACSVAKALAYAHDLPVFPVSSLAAIAHKAFQQEKELPLNTQVLALLDARMQQVYYGYFSQEIKGEEGVAAAAQLPIFPDVPLLLAGVGWDNYIAQLPSLIRARIVKQAVVFPSAQAMLNLVQSGSIKSVTAEEALPVYIRNQVTQGEPRG